MIYHEEKLENVHPDLIKLIKKCGQVEDIIIVTGHRNKADQDECFRKGTSQLPWKKSKHNCVPSLAVDICPTKTKGKSIDFRDIESFKKLSIIMFSLAKEMGIGITWGASWKMRDYPHWELS